MNNKSFEPEEEPIEDSNIPIHKDRSLIYMGVVLGIIILVMGYLTFFVDDPWKFFKKNDVPEKVVDDKNDESELLEESSSMSDEEVRSSLVKFIEAFYFDQSRGYFDPPSYFANITETFYNFHNLTHTKVKEIYWKRREDMESLRRTWIVSSLKFNRQDSRIVATYWAKESYFRPTLNQQYSAIVQYEMIINEEGKIVSLRDIDVKDEVINIVGPDTTDIIEPVESVPVENQTTEITPASENKIYEANAVDVQPEFNGGQKELIKYVSSHIKYPLAARQSNIQGKVYITFVVDKDGSITDAKVRQGIGGGCDEEALRLIKNSPKWKPGVLKGSPVKTSMVLPITFQSGQ